MNFYFLLILLIAFIVSARGFPKKSASQSSEVLVLTGGNGEDGMLASTQVYPGDSDCSVPALNQPRRDHVTFLQGDTLISCGGTSQSKTSTDCVSLNLASGADTWEQHSTLNSDLREYASHAVINDMNCIVGGRIAAKSTIECLYPDFSWVELPETIPGKGVYSSCSVNLNDGSTLFIGGSYDNTQILHRSVSGKWDATSWGKLTMGVKGHSCSLVMDGAKVLVAGGEGLFSMVMKNTIVIDVETKEQKTVGQMNKERNHFSMARIDGALVAVGGYDNDHKLDSAETFSEVTDTWELTDFKLSPAAGNSGSVTISTELLGC